MDRKIDWLLLERWFAGECTPSEAAEVQQWVDAEPANARTASVMRAAWQRTGGVEVGQGRDAAAAWSALAPKLRSGPAPRVLQLLPARRRTGLRVVAGMAAALLLVAGGTMLWRAARTSAGAASGTLHQVVTASGQRAVVTLSDGTRVRVGVASQVRFAPAFVGTRDVYLDGEAFFEVAHDPSRPFVVHTSRGTARALGTKFDVRAYHDSPEMAVVVTEGTVAFKASAMPDDSLILHRADLGRLLADGRLVDTSGVDLVAHLAWMRGELELDRTPVPEAIRQLARWYGADVELGDSALARHVVTASLSGQSLSEAVRTIATSLGARVERRDSTYVFVLAPARR